MEQKTWEWEKLLDLDLPDLLDLPAEPLNLGNNDVEEPQVHEEDSSNTDDPEEQTAVEM